MAIPGIARSSSKSGGDWSNGLSFQSSYTWSDSEDTTQASTFFSDATNGTTSAFPEFIPDYNRGPSDFNAAHNWVLNATWDLPCGRDLTGVGGALLDGWRVSGIANVRSGYPLTVFVQNNRSRSQWQPSLGPGIGRDRPSYAPGFGADNAVTGDPDAVVQSAGVRAAAGRHVRQHRPRRLRRARTCARWTWRSRRTAAGCARSSRARVPASRSSTSSTAPTSACRNLTAFAGAADGEPPLGSFGRIRNTMTSARQMQLGVRCALTRD